MSFVDCIFRGVRASEVVEASGSILFRNVKIEPAEKGRSLNSRPRGQKVRGHGPDRIENRSIAILSPNLVKHLELFEKIAYEERNAT